MIESVTCTVCQTTLEGEFCHVCGQRNTGKRVSWREIFSDFISGIFSLEHSVLATIWLIIRQPEKIIRNYWNGFRGIYHSPGKMVYYATFVIALHFTLIGSEFLGLYMHFDFMPPQVGFLLVLIPLYSVSSKLTFFKNKNTYLEHLISTIYLFSTWIIVFVIVDDIQKPLLGNFIDEGMTVAFMLVVFFWMARVHSPSKNLAKLFLLTLAQLIILILIVAIIVSLLYWINPGAINVTK